MTRAYRPAVVLGCFVALALAVSGVAAGQPPSSQRIQEEVQRTLNRERDLRRIEVSVDGTEVILRGSVPHLWAKTQAIRRALQVDGVKTVAAELELPRVESDTSIAQAIAREVQDYPHYTMWDYIDGVVRQGVVTLQGSVTPDRDKKGDLFEAIAKIRGVQEVNNNIEIQPPSQGDRELRSILAYQIFNNDLFERFVSHRNPPFHIIVHNSVVTLIGVVQSEIERRELEQIARQTNGVLRVHNKLEKVQ